MENFSTPRAVLVPRIVNVTTLAVVVAATWWSGAQRPVDQPAEAALRTPSTTLRAPALQSPTPTAPQTTVATWPAQTTVLPADGLQAVGYQPALRR